MSIATTSPKAVESEQVASQEDGRFVVVRDGREHGETFASREEAEGLAESLNSFFGSGHAYVVDTTETPMQRLARRWAENYRLLRAIIYRRLLGTTSDSHSVADDLLGNWLSLCVGRPSRCNHLLITIGEIGRSGWQHPSSRIGREREPRFKAWLRDGLSNFLTRRVTTVRLTMRATH